MLLVVPSLKLIAVRNGDSLDEGDNDRAIDKQFFSPLMEAHGTTPHDSDRLPPPCGEGLGRGLLALPQRQLPCSLLTRPIDYPKARSFRKSRGPRPKPSFAAHKAATTGQSLGPTMMRSTRPTATAADSSHSFPKSSAWAWQKSRACRPTSAASIFAPVDRIHRR